MMCSVNAIEADLAKPRLQNMGVTARATQYCRSVRLTAVSIRIHYASLYGTPDPAVSSLA